MTSSPSKLSRRGFLAVSAAVPVALYASPALASAKAAATGSSLAEIVTGLPFVESYQTNSPANLTAATNAAVRALDGFAEAWHTGTAWNNGTVMLDDYLRANMKISARITKARTEAQAKEAFIFDRRDQSYSMITGLGPLADIYKAGALAVTSITTAPDGTPSTTVSDTVPAGAPAGAATGPGSANSALGQVVVLEETLRGNYSSGNPSKNAYQYPRPWRMNEDSAVVDTGTVDAYGYPVYESDVEVCAQLLLQRSTTPASDGGFPSGHTNAFYLAGLAYAYAVPERFQELIACAAYSANTRIIAGMHSPNDVIGGRILATALAAAILADPANASIKAAARANALAYFEAQTGSTVDTLFAYAHSQGTDEDRFADREVNAGYVYPHLTYGLPSQGSAKPAKTYTAPEGAEVLLETRQPYLTAAQRRDVLASTAVSARNVMLDGFEEWGRLNLFAAADGYGAFDGIVTVAMDATQGGFNRSDAWKNDISGKGGLVKQGTGTLTLTGANTFSGGIDVQGGTLVAGGVGALGHGDVTVAAAGTLSVSAEGCGGVEIHGDYTQNGGTLQVAPSDRTRDAVLSVKGRVELAAGSTLSLTLTGAPRKGTVIPVLEAHAVRGWFDSVNVNIAGVHAVPVQTREGVCVRFA
ncbi:MAG TPA: phosphatase PAP2 family protein [Actinospica sp.]|nr:phosphatase PAP2 family protein [Actinospica sp.]